MQTQIDQDARRILSVLATKPRDEFVAAGDLAKETGLDPGRIDDAVALLVDAGYTEWIQTFGTAPFNFAEAYITSRGRYENQRLSAAEPAAPSVKAKTSGGTIVASQDAKPVLPPTPAGSPYGFTDEDWEAVSRHKARADRLYVVLGINSPRVASTVTVFGRMSQKCSNVRSRGTMTGAVRPRQSSS